MQESTITTKGQTTLPKGVRSALGRAPRDRVRYVILDGEVRLLKARPVAGLAGILARPGRKPVSLERDEETWNPHFLNIHATTKNRDQDDGSVKHQPDLADMEAAIAAGASAAADPEA